VRAAFTYSESRLNRSVGSCRDSALHGRKRRDSVGVVHTSWGRIFEAQGEIVELVISAPSEFEIGLVLGWRQRLPRWTRDF